MWGELLSQSFTKEQLVAIRIRVRCDIQGSDRLGDQPSLLFTTPLISPTSLQCLARHFVHHCNTWIHLGLGDTHPPRQTFRSPHTDSQISHCDPKDGLKMFSYQLLFSKIVSSLDQLRPLFAVVQKTNKKGDDLYGGQWDAGNLASHAEKWPFGQDVGSPREKWSEWKDECCWPWSTSFISKIYMR